METVKFRAWDTLYKEYLPNDVYAILNKTDFGAFGVMIKDWRDYKEGEYFYEGSQVLDQFTGLLDKNGNEIYEGDIYAFKTSEQGKHDKSCKTIKRVWFHNGGFGFEDWYTTDDNRLKERLYHFEAHFVTPAYYYIEFDLEVIGNIHQNPELIK